LFVAPAGGSRSAIGRIEGTTMIDAVRELKVDELE
jgi:hypothetical protein